MTQAYFKISERNRGFNDEMFALRMPLGMARLETALRFHTQHVHAHILSSPQHSARVEFLDQRHMHKLKLEDSAQRKIKDIICFALVVDEESPNCVVGDSI